MFGCVYETLSAIFHLSMIKQAFHLQMLRSIAPITSVIY